MKVFISADLEGITGTTVWGEVEKDKPDSAGFRKQMTAEVGAACKGAMEAGAKEIWVKDAHETGRNLNACELPVEVKLIKAWSGHPFQMVQELDESFDAAMMIGYHSRAGSSGSPLSHTMTFNAACVTINGRYASEFLIHAYAASTKNVPVVFVSGDTDLCGEVKEVNPGIRTVDVKKGSGASTINIHPELAVQKIRESARQALSGDFQICRISLPDRFKVEITYKNHFDAFRASFYPGAQLTDALTIAYEAENYFDILRCFLFIL